MQKNLCQVKAEPLSEINLSRPRHGVIVRRALFVRKEEPDDDSDEEAAISQLKQLCLDACIYTKDDSDTETASDDEDLPPVRLSVGDILFHSKFVALILSLVMLFLHNSYTTYL